MICSSLHNLIVPLCSGDILWIQRKLINTSKLYANTLSASFFLGGGWGVGGGRKWEVGIKHKWEVGLLGSGLSKLM